MSTATIEEVVVRHVITGGPTKRRLSRTVAFANSKRVDICTQFNTNQREALLSVRVHGAQAHADGRGFIIYGTSDGRQVTGYYDPKTRSGVFHVSAG